MPLMDRGGEGELAIGELLLSDRAFKASALSGNGAGAACGATISKCCVGGKFCQDDVECHEGRL